MEQCKLVTSAQSLQTRLHATTQMLEFASHASLADYLTTFDAGGYIYIPRVGGIVYLLRLSWKRTGWKSIGGRAIQTGRRSQYPEIPCRRSATHSGRGQIMGTITASDRRFYDPTQCSIIYHRPSRNRLSPR